MSRSAPASVPSPTAPVRNVPLALFGALILIGCAGSAFATNAPPGRWLQIDPRNPAAYPTLAAAANDARPGDTLWFAPGSGPYREELFLSRSGTADAPITVEGNGNEITGFDPLVFSAASPDAPRIATVNTPPPFVLRHRGQRLAEDPATLEFIAPTPASAISYDPATNTLTLAPDASPDGWEISARQFVVRIENASHHHYRNLVATGALNDGFNLHGRGEGLVFTNITGCHNLDEGFSAHGDISCEINGARLFGNDNGLVNIQRSRARLRDVRIWDNLGIGFELHHEAAVSAENLVVWGNGLRQFSLIGSATSVTGSGIFVHRNHHATRPWLTHKESARQTAPPATLVGDSARALAASAVLRVLDTPAPFTPALR